MKGQNL